eukprot:GGOE01019406.1.p1 GENE.GGOE01019406.1~~GGOE01019406.1.p1  ORF type:complete len:664 (-),score=157.08 GGOE01019406.1:631-2622(-)
MGGEEDCPWEKYEKVKVVGQGSFGAAVLVRNIDNGVLYISKEINVQTMSQKDRDAAQNEVEVLTRVKHPNIIQYVEHYNQGGVLHIVMEYADGGDLLGRVKAQKEDPQGRRFSEDQVMFWFIQMALGVKHMHDNKILHRDIKSANIFLTRENIVKIGDFGFGKIMANTLAQAKTLCGTPYYFSPELCMGKPYNNKSDVWALGCILAEMCILGHAYEAKNIKELMKRVIRGTYQAIPTIYSSELHRLIEKMLTKDQNTRPNIKSVLLTEYVQSKLRQFAQPDFQVPMHIAVPAGNETQKEVKEMEEFCARQRAKEDAINPLTKVDSPSSISERPPTAPRTTSPKIRGQFERRPSGTVTFKLGRRVSASSSPQSTPPVPTNAETAAAKMYQTQDFSPPPLTDVSHKDALDELISLTGDGSPPRANSTTKAGLRPPPDMSVISGSSPSKVEISMRRSHANFDASPTHPGPALLSDTPAPARGSLAASRKEPDPFDGCGGSAWPSIVQSDGRKKPPPLADKDEFGSYAVRTTEISEEKHRSVMEQVNATLEMRPGTASRGRRAVSRGTGGDNQSPPSRAQLSRSPNVQDQKEDDFSDNAVTMGSQNLRSLLIIELGDEMFNKVLQIASSDDDDDATLMKRISTLVGPSQAKEIGPLLFKLVMLEHTS